MCRSPCTSMIGVPEHGRDDRRARPRTLARPTRRQVRDSSQSRRGARPATPSRPLSLASSVPPPLRATCMPATSRAPRVGRAISASVIERAPPREPTHVVDRPLPAILRCPGTYSTAIATSMRRSAVPQADQAPRPWCPREAGPGERREPPWRRLILVGRVQHPLHDDAVADHDELVRLVDVDAPLPLHVLGVEGRDLEPRRPRSSGAPSSDTSRSATPSPALARRGRAASMTAGTPYRTARASSRTARTHWSPRSRVDGLHHRERRHDPDVSAARRPGSRSAGVDADQEPREVVWDHAPSACGPAHRLDDVGPATSVRHVPDRRTQSARGGAKSDWSPSSRSRARASRPR